MLERAHVGVRYDPRTCKVGHVESYFLKANDPTARRALWLKATIYASHHAPERAIAEAWAVAFDRQTGHVAVKTIVPFEQARFDRDRLDVDLGDLAMSPTHTRGDVASGGRRIAWDLKLSGGGAPLVHFPHAWMYEKKFPQTKIVSPLPDLRLSGDVDVCGERWTMDGWRGLIGHNWGPRHTPLYAWGHCNVWEHEEGSSSQLDLDALVVEGFSGRIKLGPTLAPPVTAICVHHRGVKFDLNHAKQLATNFGEISPRRWRFKAEDEHARVEGEMWAETDDFVGLFYANPDGTMNFCLNSKLANARVSIELHGRPPVVVRSRASALEISTMDPTHGVRMYV